MEKSTAIKPAGALAILGTIEKYICLASLVFLVLIAASEAIARLFGANIPASNAFLTHMLLMLGLFSAMFTSKSGEHLTIALSHYIKDEKIKRIFAIITGFFAVFICTLLAWSAGSFNRIGLQHKMVGFVPNYVFTMAMPLSFAVMAVRFGLQIPVKKYILMPIAIVLGTVLSFQAIANIIWAWDIPYAVYDWSYNYSLVLSFIRLPLIIIFILIAFMGAPIFTVVAGITLLIIQSAGGEAEAVSNSFFSALTDLNIIAIPLFTLTGFFLSESKAGERLVLTFRSLFSWIPGGMIIATVIICAFFTSFTGASGVTILALGGILLTILTGKSAYSERFSIGLLTSVGCIGLLFPPSLPIILVGAATRTNIIHMFLGGIIPGLILVTAMIVIGIVVSIKVKVPVESFKFGKAASSLKDSALEIILPVFLIGGYFGGIFSLVEIGAISVVYVFVAEVLIHKDIKFTDISKVFFKAMPIIGGVLCIIAAAKALSFAIVDTQAPDIFARWMRNAVESKFLFLFILNIALLIVGCFMDIFSAILVILPLISPLGEIYGIDPVHLGIIFIINLEVGFLTPPMGMNLFLASYRFGKPFTEICRYVLPFMLVQIIVVFLVTYIPVLSTFLPGLF